VLSQICPILLKQNQKQQKHKLKNGILYLKGDLTEELLLSRRLLNFVCFEDDAD
jgi:hypothetical protein